MPSTIAYRRDDILVSFPFTDLTSPKRRPEGTRLTEPAALSAFIRAC